MYCNRELDKYKIMFVTIHVHNKLNAIFCFLVFCIKTQKFNVKSMIFSFSIVWAGNMVLYTKRKT